MLDLVLPLECGGCGARSTRWCDACAKDLAVKPDEPHLVSPRADPGIPIFSLGRYAGARRQAIVAVKEHGRADLLAPLAGALGAGLDHMLTWGVVGTPLTVVPAPTRRWAARRRGGDPVTRVALAAISGRPEVTVVPALRTRAFVADSAGLSSADRQRNIAGRVKLVRPVGLMTGDVVIVDDVVTTGATARESVRVLHRAGVAVAAVLAIANA
ncbi:ComF family protein [Mycolicibacterium tusciae]|uniref:Phosphoribosyltransferase n=1 Tax=Mycolicibacterium tusciae TaxID=75922 RepID=A0A1X0JXU8_9MYCO|nr:ComF family protein [Mycolicibacterium tusciae]ORB67066.1 phosphoribosyltransferase [Mycolicibacterium tusciae]